MFTETKKKENYYIIMFEIYQKSKLNDKNE